MKTKRFRLLTVLLAAVMMLALSMNVMAAKSNAVTQDGLTAQLFTDKDSYKAGESVKANVQVDNHTGKKVYVITQITAPDGVVLENANVAFDAFLENGESWEAVGGVVTSTSNAAAAGSSTATGDNMQAGFWVILTALAVCGLFALFVYGKNRTTWLSIMLCIAMVGGMVVAAVPVQAAGVEGSISLSCTIKVDGEDEVISATVSYMSYEEDVEAAEETAEAATPSEPSQESSEPSQESSEPSQESSEPSQEPSQESSEPSEDTSEPSEPETVVPVDTIYVSSTAKVGEGDGTIDNPFANIGEAQALVRKINEADVYPEKGITVYFREGQYRVDETILFEEADSGKEGAPVVYSAYNDEEVMFVGGIDVNLSAFSSITDASISDRLVEGTENNIKQIDLAALGITDYGEMNVYGHALAYFREAGIEVPQAQAPELFFDGEVMDIARYPNEGWLYIKEVIDTGDVIQNWTQYASGNNFIPEEDRPDTVSGSVFTVDDTTKERMKRWNNATESWVYGFWQQAWSDQSMPVEYIDATTGTVKTKIPSGKEIIKNRNYYFYNLLEELDVPGEYFIDRTSGVLYFYPPKENGTVTLSLLDGSIVEFAAGAHDIDFVGIEFKAGRSHAISMNTVDRINIKDCDVSKFGDLGVYMKDCKNVTITGCHLYDLGKGGISVLYDTNSEVGSNMIKELESMGIKVENCEINNFSRIQQTYSPAIRTAGVGMIVRNCKIYDSTHMAIAIGGNDTLIENNEIFDVLQTSTDMGVFYGGYDKEQMGIIIKNNYIHDVSSSAGSDIVVVYCDDTKDGVTAESNLIVNFNGAGALLNGGWDNIFRNNVLINMPKTVRVTAIGMRGDDKYEVETHESYRLFRQVYSYPAYQKYPHWEEKLEALLENNAPKYVVVEDNVIINVDKDINYESYVNWSVDNINRDNTIKASRVYGLAEVGFKDIENGDFTIKEDSVLFTDINGFKAYDFSQIGLIGESPEKPSGSLGPVNPPSEEEPTLPEGYLLIDEFSGTELSGWAPTSPIPGTCYAKVNAANQLEISMGAVVGINIDKRFDAYEGKVAYELDFKIERDGDTTIDAGIMIVRGKDTAGAAKSLVNIKTKGGKFTVYDGSGNYTPTTECQDDVTYKVKVVADPETDTYNLYVDGEEIITGRKLTCDAASFDGIRIAVDKKSATGTPKLYYDNLKVQKVEESTLPEGYLLIDEFPGNELSDWVPTGAYPANSYAKVNDENQLEIGMSASGGINIDKSFATYAGKVSYELDFKVERDGSKDIDAGIMIARGKDTRGNAQSIVNIKVYSDDVNGKVFGAYDGEGECPTAKACADGVTYKVKLVVDPETDTYDLYVDNERIIEGRPLRYDAASFDGIRISVKRTSAENAPKVYYDNLNVQKVEETIPSEEYLLSDEFSGTELSGWAPTSPIPGTCYTKVNDANQLEISMGAVVGINIDKSFEAYEGKVSYELDFKIARGGDTDMDAGIMILRGKDTAGAAKSLVNIKTKGGKFTVYDGSGKYTPTTECKDDVTYKVKVVADPEADTYNLYVDGEEIITGRKLTYNAASFDGIRISVTKNSATGTPKLYYDNLKVQKVEEPTS